MPNEIMIKIKVENDSSKGFEETLAEARAFGGKLKEEMDHAGKEAGKKAVDEIERMMREAEPPAIDVEVKTEEAKLEIKEVEEELRHLDHEDIGVDVSVHSAKAIAEAELLKKELKHELSSDGGAGKSWVKSFTGALSKGFQEVDISPSLMGVGLSVAAAFAPLIGGSIAAAVVGSVGLGGIIGGVIIAARDARVKSAFTSMKKDLGDALKLDAAPFVPVVVAGLGQVEREFQKIDLKGIFANLAPQVQPVLSGLLDLVGSLGNALSNIAAKSGPVLKQFGTEFHNLGRALDQGLSSLAGNSKQEASALHDLFAVIDALIFSTFALVKGLTEVYGAFHKIFELSPMGFYEMWQDHSEKVTGAVKDTVAAVVAQVDANNRLTTSTERAAEADKVHAAAIKKVSDALKASTDPAFALIDAQKQVNDAQTAYNKAVKTGGQNSTAAKNAQLDLEKAMVNYVSAAATARGGTAHLTDEQKALLKAAGASNATIKALDASLKKAYDSAKKLDNFNIDINVIEHFKQTGKYISPSQIANPTQLYSGLYTGGIKGAASGATSSDWTWVGENGPELRKLPPGTGVKSHGDSMRMAGGMDGAGGAMIVQLHVDGHVIAQAMVDPQRKFVQQNFGGNVQKAYGVGA